MQFLFNLWCIKYNNYALMYFLKNLLSLIEISDQSFPIIISKFRFIYENLNLFLKWI